MTRNVNLTQQRHSNEQFDLNEASVAGVIQKLWGRASDVYARLRVSRSGRLVESEDAESSYVNLRFANGKVAGQDLSLGPGDIVRVSGYLTHTEYNETLRKFLEAAGKPGFLKDVPEQDRPAWQAITFKRVNTMFNVMALEFIENNGKSTEQDATVNRTAIEGIVARQWKHSQDLYVRLAVYDMHTPASPVPGNFGRPRRKPHYLTVVFPAGKTTGGRPVTVRMKDRLRVTGELQDQGYRLSLHEALLRTGSQAVVDLMQRLPNAEQMQEITAQQESLHIQASSVIVYSNHKTRSD